MIAARRRIPFLLGLAFALAVMSATPAMAAPGDRDRNFSDDGRVTTNFTSGNDGVADVGVQANGKIVAAGRASGTGGFGQFALVRYNSDGTLDATFGHDGKATTNFTELEDHASGVAIQADGKIVAAGVASVGDFDTLFALARYNSNGRLDPTFSGDGKVMTDFTGGEDAANDVALQADGRIVAAGTADNSRFALARYNSDGTLDATFGSGGKVTTDFQRSFDGAAGVAVQADGKIVAAGAAAFDRARFAVARYNANGALDTSFSGDGKVTADLTVGDDFALDVAIQADGKIVAVGDAGFCCELTSAFALVRYRPNGTLDGGFGDHGTVITEFSTDDDVASAVAIQLDGRIVAAGTAGYGGPGSGNFAVARYDSDGALDTTFGGDGEVTTEFPSASSLAVAVALQADGKIVAAGRALFGDIDGRFALVRYLA